MHFQEEDWICLDDDPQHDPEAPQADERGVEQRVVADVALAGPYFVVGAPFAPGGPNADRDLAGAAWVFELE